MEKQNEEKVKVEGNVKTTKRKRKMKKKMYRINSYHEYQNNQWFCVYIKSSIK